MKILKLIIVALMIAVISMPAVAAVKKNKGKHLRKGHKITRTVKKAKYKKYSRRSSRKTARNRKSAKKMSKLQRQMAALDKKVRVFKKEPVYVDKNEFIRGSVYVDSKEKGLIVYLDNDSMMTVPATFDNVKGGKHVIEGYKGADLVYRQYVDIKNSDPIMLKISAQGEIANEQPTIF